MPLEEFVANGHARRGGRVENYFCILGRRELYKNFGLVARFNRPVNDEALLFAALRALVLKYPILASSVVSTDRSDLTKPMPEHDYIKVMDTLRLSDVLIDLPQNIKECASKEEQLAMLNQITWKYGDETTLWKVGFLDDHTLAFLSNHVCSDGVSGKNFIQEIHHLFNTVEPTDDNTVKHGYLLNYVADGKTLPRLPPPIDEVVDYNPPWSFYLPYFWNRFVLHFFCATNSFAHRDNTHSYRIINVPPAKLSKLRATLKEKKVTISPYLNCAWYQAFQVTLLSKTWLGLTDFSIPCDVRQFIPAGVDIDEFKFGANTGGNSFYHCAILQHDWSSINYFNKFFQWCKDQKNYLHGLGMITSPFVEQRVNLDKIIQDATVGIQRTGGVMSNIGVLKPSLEGEEKFEVEDILFSKNSGGTQFSFSISAITSSKSGLNIVVTMAENAILEDKFDELVEKFEANILSFA